MEKLKANIQVSGDTMSPKAIVPMLVGELKSKSLSDTKLELAIYIDGYHARISVKIFKIYKNPSEPEIKGERIIFIKHIFLYLQSI